MSTLHLVSHTHWDREWYLPYQQFRLKLVHLVDGLLDLMQNDMDYKHFMLDGQTIVLEDYLLVRPEKEEIIRKLVKQGRLVIGPWHILPDEFLVSPEATIRNLLQGDHTCKRFGRKMLVGYEPDTFGHIGQLPQILRGFGFDTACLWRGVPDLPSEIWWEAPDGSRVFTIHMREGYGNAAALPTSNPDEFVKEVTRLQSMLDAHSIAQEHLLLMHGTDHMEPPSDTSLAINTARKKLKAAKLIHSTLSDYITAVKRLTKGSQLPVVKGELRECQRAHLLPGVLSTRMWIKQRNRASETLLEKWAEPFSTFAELISYHANKITDLVLTGHLAGSRLSTPAGLLKQAWHLLMENHPHDSICGCSIDQVHDEMKVRFDQVDQIGEELTRQALQTVAGEIDTQPKPSTPDAVSALVVFNPSSASRTDHAQVEIKLPAVAGAITLTDENGRLIPCQLEGLGSQDLINVIVTRGELAQLVGNLNEGRIGNLSIQQLSFDRQGDLIQVEAILGENISPDQTAWELGTKLMKEYINDSSVSKFHIHARALASTRLSFIASNVPGLGWKTYYIRTKESPPPLRPIALAWQTLSHKLSAKLKPPIENAFFRIDVDRQGKIGLFDKRDGTRFIGLNQFLDGGDCGDEYNFCPPESDHIKSAHLKRVSVIRTLVQQSIELQLEIQTPIELSPDRKYRSKRAVPTKITTRLTFWDGVPRVDVHTEVINHAKDHRLRVHFPAPFSVQKGCHDGHFEVVTRSVGVPDFDETWVEDPRPEVPQRTFTDISNGERGLMIANRGLPEVEVIRTTDDRSEIALTLLRCVGWLSRDDFSNRKNHAGPFLPTPAAQMEGKWEFEYSIIPHAGDWNQAFSQAYAFETPFRAIGTGIHSGELPEAGSFVSIEPEQFVVSAVKMQEAGHGWLVRGYNITGDNITATLKPWRTFNRVELVNLAEKKLKFLKPSKDGSIHLSIRGHEIVTVLFRNA